MQRFDKNMFKGTSHRKVKKFKIVESTELYIQYDPVYKRKKTYFITP